MYIAQYLLSVAVTVLATTTVCIDLRNGRVRRATARNIDFLQINCAHRNVHRKPHHMCKTTRLHTICVCLIHHMCKTIRRHDVRRIRGARQVCQAFCDRYYQIGDEALTTHIFFAR